MTPLQIREFNTATLKQWMDMVNQRGEILLCMLSGSADGNGMSTHASNIITPQELRTAIQHAATNFDEDKVEVMPYKIGEGDQTIN